MKALVSGAGGFVGSWLVKYLVSRGDWVRGVDLSGPQYEDSAAHEFLILDLRNERCVNQALYGVDEVYHLAADMGGIGYISKYHSQIAMNNTRIDMNMIGQCPPRVRRFFYASSACVYPIYLQTNSAVTPLTEREAIPADPEPGYGWEKLYAEQLMSYHNAEYGFPGRIARFHNVFGPFGTFEGGKEKSIAAICRKVAQASDGGKITLWGDGQQTRSFLYIEDCVDGIDTITQSEVAEPLNLGSDRLVTITELAELIISISGKELCIEFDLDAPQGVRGRNSDNTKIQSLLGWKPKYSLEEGLGKTYAWIEEKLLSR